MCNRKHWVHGLLVLWRARSLKLLLNCQHRLQGDQSQAAYLIERHLVVRRHAGIWHHRRMELLRRQAKLRRWCTWIRILHGITKLRASHRDELGYLGPCRLWLNLNGEERGVLRPHIEVIRIITTRFPTLSTFGWTRSILC